VKHRNRLAADSKYPRFSARNSQEAAKVDDETSE
jgi:hypothetical protein